MPACDHCMLEVSEREAVYDEISGQRKVFCCRGCNGIYRLIRSEGLEDFYARRRDWTPGPAGDVVVDTASFMDLLRPAGNEIETDVIIDGIRCASCVWLNEKVLQRSTGITFAQVNYATHRARLRWDPGATDIAAILARIRSIGYQPKPFLPRSWEEAQERQSRDLLIRFGTAAFFSMQLMLFSIALYAGYFQGIDLKTKFVFHAISFGLTTPVLFYSGWPLIAGALRGLRNRAFNMDVLIAAGALAAYGYSVRQMFSGGEVYFDTSAMIITLILLGRYLEAGAKRKAMEVVGRLLQLSPKEARKLAVAPEQGASDDALRHAVREMVPVSSLRQGDVVEVVPGEKVPVDGVVVAGSSEADEAMLTGESKPSAKSVGAAIFGGTQNLYGSVVFRVTRTGSGTVLSRIIQAVEDAQARRAPIQSAADRVVGWFVPAILLIAGLTFAGWLLHGAPVARAVMNAVSVLVIACPCALGLATPLAILIGTSSGASRGILIKGGDVIEKASRVDTVILDKTGTLTEGKPVVSIAAGVGLADADALRLAYSLERSSEHSLGKAFVAAAHGMEPHEVADFSAVPGKGIRGTVQGKQAFIGNREFIRAEAGVVDPEAAMSASLLRMVRDAERAGATIVFLCHDNALRGVFAVADTIRPEAAETVLRLTRLGLGVSLVTGDNRNTAESVAERAGIPVVMAQATPIGKAAEVERLEKAGQHVLMAGDGINDAPALVRATVGVAMGRATDITLESADIVIMRPDLRLIADAVALTKKTFRIIRQNIFWAFFYNIVVIPLAIIGVLHPIVAAGAMAFSSLSVVGNSLRARLP